MKKALKAAEAHRSAANTFDLAVNAAKASLERLNDSTKAYGDAIAARSVAKSDLKHANSAVKKTLAVMKKDKKYNDASVEKRQSAAKSLGASKDLLKKAKNAAAAAKAQWEKVELARVEA